MMRFSFDALLNVGTEIEMNKPYVRVDAIKGAATESNTTSPLNKWSNRPLPLTEAWKPREPPADALPIPAIERPITLGDAARTLGVPYHVVQRAARRGLVPTYRLGTSRPYVKLRDLLDLMERSTTR
jgi:hypothetical protein